MRRQRSTLPVRSFSGLASELLPAAIFCLLALLIPLSVSADQRDGGLSERRDEEATSACLDDPACARAMVIEYARRSADEKRARAEYEAKPFAEKLLPWLAIAALAWLIWKWAGRGPPSK